MELTDEDKEYYLQQTKTISLHILLCILIFFAGVFIVVFIGLLFRFLRLIFGSKVKPSAKKVIVITGATSGIGLALAKRFHRKGFSVFATYYNSEEPGYAELREIVTKQSTNDEADQNIPKMFLVYMDVRSELSIDVAANEIERLIRKFQLELYSVVCNAGVANDCSFEINRLENMHRTIQTNLLGVVMVAKRFTLPIIKSKGRIVLVSSAICNTMLPLWPVYIATKAAIKSFSDCLNEDLERYGASCRCVLPGNLLNKTNIILTVANTLQDSVARLSPEERELYKKGIEHDSRAVNKMLKFRINNMNEDPKRTADMYVVDLPQGKNDYKTTRMAAICEWLFSFIDGGQSGSSKKKDVDEMGTLTAFDYAVCSKNPPRRCYCGNRFFQYISGPLACEYMPQIFVPIFYCIFKGRLAAF